MCRKSGKLIARLSLSIASEEVNLFAVDGTMLGVVNTSNPSK